MTRTIAMCIGVPKAGTSWLYETLKAHPQVHLRGVKELHYFDTLADPDPDVRAHYVTQLGQKSRQLRRKTTLKAPLAHLANLARARDIDRWRAILADPDPAHRRYLDYLHAGAGRRPVVGDFTPSYCLLDLDGFRTLAGLGGDVRFIVLLRDPVDRAWSHIRMLAKRARRNWDIKPEVSTTRRLDAFLEDDSDNLYRQSDYARILTDLHAAVPPGRVHVAFYEELFLQPGYDAITDFLGLARASADGGQIAHKGMSLAMTPEREARIYSRLKDQYTFCAGFLDRPLPARWTERQALGGRRGAFAAGPGAS